MGRKDISTHYYGDDCDPPHPPMSNADKDAEQIAELKRMNAEAKIGTGEIKVDMTSFSNEVLATELLSRIFKTPLGADDTPEHLRSTPLRYIRMLEELNTTEEFTFTTFPAESDEMITLGPIPFYTVCAHHVVPFYGQAWVGYVPNKLICGLSKIPRLIRNEAKGWHVQETLTTRIANSLEDGLSYRIRTVDGYGVSQPPIGVAVVLKGEHMCMAMRGVRQPGVMTTTSAMRGCFSDHKKLARNEFLNFIGGK